MCNSTSLILNEIYTLKFKIKIFCFDTSDTLRIYITFLIKDDSVCLIGPMTTYRKIFIILVSTGYLVIKYLLNKYCGPKQLMF